MAPEEVIEEAVIDENVGGVVSEGGGIVPAEL